MAERQGPGLWIQHSPVKAAQADKLVHVEIEGLEVIVGKKASETVQ